MALKHALAIAGLMAASTAAFAQTLSAKIDFPFQAGSKTYPAADYRVYISTNGAAPVITVSNPATNVSHMLLSLPGDTHVESGQAKLVFNCAQTCSLAQVQAPTGVRWSMRQPKRTPAELERMAVVVVPLHTVNAD